MEGTTVIELPRWRVAAFHVPTAFIGTIFPLIFILGVYPAEHIQTWFKVCVGIAAIAGAAVFLNSVYRIYRIMTTPGIWRVTIDAHHLTWETALPQPDFPLRLRIADIAQVVRSEIWTTDSDGDSCVDTKFVFHLRTGDTHTISQDNAGLNPHRVFLALGARGVSYELWTIDRTRDVESTERQVERIC